MKIRPLSDRVLVERRRKAIRSRKGGFIIPDTAKEKPQQARSLPSSGKRNDEGKIAPMNVKVGDLVLMPKYGGTEVKIDDKEFQLVRRGRNILGVIE